MARIPTYQKDIYISDLDRLIGTDGDTNEYATKNFFLGDIATYVIDKFIDPDATDFKIPVFNQEGTRITGSIMSQDSSPSNGVAGTKLTVAGNLEINGTAKIDSLTSGFLPYINPTGILADSFIYQDTEGHVGIGVVGTPPNPTHKFEVYDLRDENNAFDYSVVVTSDINSPFNQGTGGIKNQLSTDGGVTYPYAISLVTGTTSSELMASTKLAFYSNSDLNTSSATGFSGFATHDGTNPFWQLGGDVVDAAPSTTLKVVGTGEFTDQVTIPETPVAGTDAASKAYVDLQNSGQVSGTGTTQTLPVWSDGPNGALGDSAIKQHNGNNITIGAFPSDTSEGSYTLSVGNDNDFTSGTARVLAVGADNVGTSVDVVDSAVIGLSNEANSSYSLTVGQRNQTNSGTSFVAGVDNVTSSGVPRQFVIGRDNTVDSIDTIVLGDRNIVTETGDGFGSMMVFGHLNDVKGDRILCLGTSNIAKSDNQGAYIIGTGSSSTGDRTYSVGQQNAITANESYAFGKSNTIVGSASAAVGTNNSLNASEKAYAFGFGNDNINFKSFAIGDNNDVLDKKRTYLIGRENKPATDNTIILGQFSDPTVLRSDNLNGRSTVAFGVGVDNEIRRTAWEFRGKPTSEGDTSAGDSMQVMAHALRYSTSYGNDAEASTAGVEVGQLYRNGNDVKIRMSGDESSEATYLVPFNVTASPGGSSTLSADDIATLVKIRWVGANGTYILNLPPAADMQYRKVRFISDGTFGNGAGDKVLITPNGTETVDGASDFEISKSYEGVALWSDGTEWIIIQAKAH